MSEQAVADAPQERQLLILLHGEGADIADAPPIQVAGCGVVHGVAQAPVVVGREREDAEHPPDPVVHRLLAEEGAVSAVVLDHEEPHQEGGRGNGEKKPPPDVVAHGNPGDQP